jgi:4-amino-4-deoxy-L-arabinose transferase-like glycosyltransferase
VRAAPVYNAPFMTRSALYNSTRFISRLSAHWLALLLILAAFALRTHRLGNKAIWWDEGFSVFLARMPLAEMLDATAHDTHPPGYYAALHFWRIAVGDSEVALRLLSVLAGLLILPLAFRFVRTLAGPRAALCALGLLSLSRVLIWYAQEVRQYSLAACLALASALLALAVWRPNAGWQSWLGYIATNVAGLLTLYLFSSALVAQNVAFVFSLRRAPDKRRLIVRWASAQVIIGLTYLPWVWYYWPRAPHFFVPPTTLTTVDVIKLYADTLFVGNPSDLDRYWGVMLLGGGLLVGGWWLARYRQGPRPTPSADFGQWVVLAGTLVPPLLVWLLNLPTGLKLSFVPNPRYFVVLAPWAICGLGIGVNSLSRRAVGRVGTCVLVAI